MLVTFWLLARFNKSNICAVSVWPSNRSSKCHVPTLRSVALKFPISAPGNQSLCPSSLDLRRRVCLSSSKAQNLPFCHPQCLAQSEHLPLPSYPPPSPWFKYWFQASHFLKTKNFPLHCGFLVLLPKLLEGGRLASLHPPPRTSSVPLATSLPFTGLSPGRAANDFLTSKNSGVFSGQILFWCS